MPKLLIDGEKWMSMCSCKSRSTMKGCWERPCCCLVGTHASSSPMGLENGKEEGSIVDRK